MKMTKFIAALAFLFLTSLAQASVLYDESISGDLDDNLRHFDLPLGINSILGSSVFLGQDSDFDGRFNFSLNDGLVLKNIDFLISNVSVTPSTLSLNTIYELKIGYHILEHNIDVLGNFQQSMFEGVLPLTGHQDIGFRNSTLATSGTDSGGSWDYEIRFTVSPVPEPSTWAMLLAGLGLAGFMARKQTV